MTKTVTTITANTSSWMSCVHLYIFDLGIIANSAYSILLVMGSDIFIPGELREQYKLPGIEPGTTTCKARDFPAVPCL